MITTTEVKILEDLKPEVVFSEGGSIEILEAIKDKAFDFDPDVSTQKGRDEIKSRAYAISRSKTFLDNAGKEFKAQYQRVIKPIDAERKTIRDYLDLIQEEVRRPLTVYETEKKRKQEQEEADRQKEVQLENERLAKIEADKVAKAEQEARDKQAEIDAENARIKAEQEECQRLLDIENAELKMKKIDADSELKRKQDEADAEAKAKQDEVDENNRLEREAIEAERDIVEAEKYAIAQQKLDEEKQKIAIEEAKQKAIEEERIKVSEEKAEAERIKKIEDDRILKEKEKQAHIDKIEAEAFESLNSVWDTDGVAELILEAIKEGEIKNITINY